MRSNYARTIYRSGCIGDTTKTKLTINKKNV